MANQHPCRHIPASNACDRPYAVADSVEPGPDDVHLVIWGNNDCEESPSSFVRRKLQPGNMLLVQIAPLEYEQFPFVSWVNRLD
jgi:hypothetical protein